MEVLLPLTESSSFSNGNADLSGPAVPAPLLSANDERMVGLQHCPLSGVENKRLPRPHQEQQPLPLGHAGQLDKNNIAAPSVFTIILGRGNHHPSGSRGATPIIFITNCIVLFIKFYFEIRPAAGSHEAAGGLERTFLHAGSGDVWVRHSGSSPIMDAGDSNDPPGVSLGFGGQPKCG